MRVTGGGHALGEEAASVLRRALSLAAHLGHAQVTTLHIVGAVLWAPAAAGILRAACIRSLSQSHSHPVQHDALDLRLDLALRRLPVNVAHGHVPAPSNAFVAALRRAHAHRRRRGEGEGEVDVDVERLIVAVLDDPSVDRVMRAAIFSSSQVRASVDVESAAASSEQSSREGRDVVPSSSNSVPLMIRAGGGGQESLHTVPEIHRPVVQEGSEGQASKAKSGAGRPATFGGTELDPTAYKHTICSTSARHSSHITHPDGYILVHDTRNVEAAYRRPMFTELTAANFKLLCDALELHVPRHRNIVPGLSSTVLRCRSGVTRSRPSSSSSLTAATCLLFLGRDGGGKMVVARELARLVFGSYADFIVLQVQGDPAMSACTGKRPRSPENNGGLRARLFEAVLENPHRVILIDGVDGLDRDSETCIRNAIAGGGMARGCNGDVVTLEDAIVILSASDVLDSRYVASSSSSPRPRPPVKRRCRGQNRDKGDAAEMEMEVSSPRRHVWDLNICAVEGEEEEEEGMADDVGIMNVVDGVFLFN